MRKRSLETLRQDVAKSCRLRGHSMRWSKPFEKAAAVMHSKAIAACAEPGYKCKTTALLTR